jgi:hypothetical protein
MMDAFTVRVPGSPAGLTASREVAEPWKRAIADAVRAARQRTDFVREPCAIDLAFHLTPARQKDTALYNLLKSTIDGLSNAVFAPSPSGQPGEWSREDWWITELRARKVIADDPGVEITLGPARGGATDTTVPSSVDVFVPGSPPLWPGDGAGQRKVLAARELMRDAIPAGVQMPSALCLDFTFMIEPARSKSSDLDNYCVPAAQNVCAVLYGNVRQGVVIVELTARKILADALRDVGTRIRVLSAHEYGQPGAR